MLNHLKLVAAKSSLTLLVKSYWRWEILGARTVSQNITQKQLFFRYFVRLDLIQVIVKGMEDPNDDFESNA